MPVLNTRAALSAKGFGNSSISTYWAETAIVTLNPGSQASFVDGQRDSLGNVYLVGKGLIDSVLANYPILVKLNSFGVLLWQKYIPNIYFSSNFRITSVTVDSSDNVLVLLSDQVTTYRASMLIKLDSSGTILWQIGLERPSSALDPYTVSTDSSGNVYVSGYSSGVGVISKCNSSGVLQWQKAAASSATAVTFNGSYTDGSGNVYVTGTNATEDTVLVKFDSSGAVVWTKFVYDSVYSGTTGFSYGRSVAADSGGNIYVASSGQNATNGYFGSIASFNPSGVYQGSVYLTASFGNVFFESMAIDASDNVYACGTYYNFTAVRRFMVIAKFTTSGTLLWVRCVGDGINGNVTISTGKVFVDSTGAVYACCTILSAGLVVKIPLDGSLTSQTRYKIGMTGYSGLYQTLYYDDISYAGFGTALNRMTSSNSGTYAASSGTQGTTVYTVNPADLGTSFCPF